MQSWYHLQDIVTNLDFNLIECLAIVDTNNRSNHFRKDQHVPQMCLDDFWFLQWTTFLLCFPKLLQQGLWFPFQTTL